MISAETLIIYKKYTYFLDVLDDDRFTFFYPNDDNSFDIEVFFNARLYVIHKHYIIRNDWFTFKRQRYNIIKRFNNKKIKIKISTYTSILLKLFCRDLTNIIIEFAIKK